MNDKYLLDALEQIVKNERDWEDVILCYDHEDGFWLATVERGTTHPWPVKDEATARPRRTLRAAIEAAVNWHNKEAKKPFHESMAITPPTHHDNQQDER